MSIDEQTRGRDYHNEIRAERDRLREVLSIVLDEAEDVFVCMADATGIDRHNLPKPFVEARAALAAISED